MGGWGICDIVVDSSFICDDMLTIVCEMTIPGTDVSRISYGTGASGSENKAGGRKEPSKLANDLEHLLDNSTLTDVTIKCDNKTLECHKAILSARSNVFQAMFTHDMKERKNNEILIEDLDYATVADMVRFIYAGRLSDMAPKAGTLLSAAEKYDIRDLKEICCNHLSANLNTEQIVDILVLSDLYKAAELKATSIQFLLSHKEEVFSQPDWKAKLAGHPDLLMEVLEATVDKKDSAPPNKRRRKK